MQTLNEVRQIIPLVTSKTVEFREVGDILFVKGMENYCKVYLLDDEKYVLTSSLGKVYAELMEYGFFQCHKSFVINLKHVRRYKKEGVAELQTGENIPVSRRRKNEFLGRVVQVNWGERVLDDRE